MIEDAEASRNANEINRRFCELFGVDAANCSSLTIEITPFDYPTATATMLLRDDKGEHYILGDQVAKKTELVELTEIARRNLVKGG